MSPFAGPGTGARPRGLGRFVAAAALAAGCSGPGAEAVARRHVVEIRGMEYQPAVLRLAAGDTVVWVNRDVVPHTATGGDGTWDSSSLAPGASWSRTFAEADAGEYACTFHPGMTARLEIRRGS